MIAVFTKYDQFKRNVKMKLEDEGCPSPETELGREAERIFHNFYLSELEATPNLKFVQLESEVLCHNSVFLFTFLPCRDAQVW